MMKPNQTYRPVSFDLEAEMSKQMIEIAENHPWNIFLEIISLDSGLNALPPFDSESEVLVFFKLYDPRLRKIYYCGHHYVQSGSTFGESSFELDGKLRFITELRVVNNYQKRRVDFVIFFFDNIAAYNNTWRSIENATPLKRRLQLAIVPTLTSLTQQLEAECVYFGLPSNTRCCNPEAHVW